MSAAIKDQDLFAIKEIAHLADTIPIKTLEKAMDFLEYKELIKRPVPSAGKSFSKNQKKHLYIGEIKRIKIPQKEQSP
jgi:hypothetical protein